MLAAEQHDVVLIDTSAERLAEVQEKLDVMTVMGSGTSADVLTRCEVQRADMLVAVTSIDEVNIIACMMADRMGVKTTIARVRSDEFSDQSAVLKPSDFGISLIIHPEESAASEVTRLIRRASATDVLSFCGGRLQLVGMRLDVDNPVVGWSVQDIAMGHAHLTFRIMGISRGIRTILPRGSEILRKNDQVFVLTRPKEYKHVAAIFGKKESTMHHVMILGGTAVGAKVARQLSAEKNRRVKLIETNRGVAQRLAEDLQDVLVIHGDAADIDLMAAEGLMEMDAFVAVTEDEESNLVNCLVAKHLGVRKTVALLSKGAYIPISQTIGLDAAVSKKLAISREVMRYLRGKHVLSVATVHGIDAEILEMEAMPRAPITFKPLMEQRLPKDLLIGSVTRSNGNLEIATGKTQIHPGDRVMLFVMPRSLHEVEKFFNKR